MSDLPSGKLSHSYGKSPFSIGKSAINGPFSIAMLVYQRLPPWRDGRAQHTAHTSISVVSNQLRMVASMVLRSWRSEPAAREMWDPTRATIYRKKFVYLAMEYNYYGI